MAEETQLKNIKRTIMQTLKSFDSAYPLVDLYVRFQWPDLCTKYVQVELSVILLENCKVSYEIKFQVKSNLMIFVAPLS